MKPYERSEWYFTGYRKLDVSSAICQNQYPCLIEVEIRQKETPIVIDRYLLETATESLTLKAPNKGYFIKAYNQNGKLISQIEP